MKIAIYDTNLTDAQWAYLQPLLPQPAQRGRPPKDRRRIIDAILYLVKCGCPWRYVKWVHDGKGYIYRVLAPERATLSIVKGADGCWGISQLKLACNETPKPITFQSVRAWLNQYSLSV